MNVLVVEDRPLTAYLFKEYLTKVVSTDGTRWEATQAGDVTRALELLELNQFDAVVLDYFLPGGDSRGLLKEVRTSPRIKQGATIPVVFVTGAGDDELKELYLSLDQDGLVSVLRKPVDPQVIVQDIERLARRM